VWILSVTSHHYAYRVVGQLLEIVIELASTDTHADETRSAE